MTPELLVTDDPASAALEVVAGAMNRAASARGRCLLVLSGGSTPLPLYRLLADRPDLPWSRTHLFWGDERFVPRDHPDSNAGAASRSLLERVQVPPEQIHRWPILESPAASAAAYQATLLKVAGDPPLFDVTLLGLGSDCHTASLFPGSGGHLAAGLTIASHPRGTAQARLSLTAAALSGSRLVLFLVTGAGKRDALTRLLAPAGDPERCPGRAIAARERLLLVTDQRL